MTVCQVWLRTCKDHVYLQNDQTWVSPLLQGILTINQELGGSGGVEESVVNVTVPAISVKWMTNRNKCDRTEMRCSAHQG